MLLFVFEDLKIDWNFNSNNKLISIDLSSMLCLNFLANDPGKHPS